MNNFCIPINILELCPEMHFYYWSQFNLWNLTFDLFRWDWASQVAQLVKNSPAMQETLVRSLSWEDPLQEGMATHCLAGYSPWGHKELTTTERLCTA